MGVNGTIQARPTVYKGIRMRSRLEADYAAYLDRTALQDGGWRYEPDCFAGPNGQWLPDFAVIFDGRVSEYIEVKPAGLLRDALAKHRLSVDMDLVDPLLTKMTTVWESRPEVGLRLTFWDFGASSPYFSVWWAPPPWMAAGNDAPISPWIGMGQWERMRSVS